MSVLQTPASADPACPVLTVSSPSPKPAVVWPEYQKPRLDVVRDTRELGSWVSQSCRTIPLWALPHGSEPVGNSTVGGTQPLLRWWVSHYMLLPHTCAHTLSKQRDTRKLVEGMDLSP